MIIVAGHLVVDPTERDRYVAAHADLVTRARSAPGCLELSIAADAADAARVAMLEIWATQAELDAFRDHADPPSTDIEIRDAVVREYVVDHDREPFTHEPDDEDTAAGAFLGSVVMPATDTARAAAFWRSALGYDVHPRNPDFLVPPGWEPGDGRGEPGPAHLHVDGGDPLHVDLWVRDGVDLEDEVARLVGLGATRVPWEYGKGAQHVVLRDPEGTLFCVCR